MGQESVFRGQIIKFKFSYHETSYSQKANGYLGTNSFDRLMDDYNGHTYWFSFSAHHLMGKTKIPSWLNLAFGYSANGMYDEFENKTTYRGVDIPETIRYRQFLFSLDVD